MKLCSWWISERSVSILILKAVFVCFNFVHLFRVIKECLDVAFNLAWLLSNNFLTNFICNMSQIIVFSAIYHINWSTRFWLMGKNQVVWIHMCVINANLNYCFWCDWSFRKTTRADFVHVLNWLLFFRRVVLGDFIVINISLISSP